MVRAAAAAFLAVAPARANPSMSADFDRMMAWLSNEVVQGLAFNAGSTFDPPNELRPWHVQPDVSLGMGFVPLNKKRFPEVETPALRDKGPSNLLPSSVSFPNLALHLRVGLPRRWDLTVRGADMTVPKGYRISPETFGDGQSNSFGFGLRKHLFGGNRPLLSVAGNYNYVQGHFNFRNAWQRLELTPGFQVDTQNVGRLEWSVNSIGANAVVSQTYGIWTPFMGAGWNYMSGSMKSRLQADFATPLIAPSIGEASDHPEQHQARVIVGTQLDRSRFSMFVNGEMKAVGASSGKTFIVQMGLVTPFRIGAGSLAARGSRGPGGASRSYVRAAPPPEPETELPKLEEPRQRWAELPLFRRRGAEERPLRAKDKEIPEMIFIQ
ncbi:MAG: hypothetical protein HY554_15850 [Elusimicrobia bacterium]|nr:hypothetical protein [Elusimicrobiota bacterium]